MVDYIIVGAGLAGISFAEKLRKVNKSFIVIDAGSAAASAVAAGIYNPIVLKRLRMVENGSFFLTVMNHFYDDLAIHFGREFRNSIPIYRRLANIEEQNDWYRAADAIPQFINPQVTQNNYWQINAPFGFGLVHQTGWVATNDLISFYKAILQENQLIRAEVFAFDQLSFTTEAIIYKDVKAKHIIFAEGTEMVNNPYFNYLPIQKTKGELLTVYIPGLELREMINGSIFLMPLGNNLFKVGATYSWNDYTLDTTENAKEVLCNKLEAIINVPYQIINQEAGLRPTVTDRKPLLGTHSIYKRLHVLNGMGSRGVLLAPLCVDWLYNAIELGAQIPSSFNISRFAEKFVRSDYS